jgi:hypothetical protein
MARRSELGMSVIELVIAAAVTLAVTGTAFALIGPVGGVFRAQMDAADTRQRVRAALAAVQADLHHAGSPAAGSPLGPLVHSLPPVWPGSALPGDATGSDALTVMYVPSGGAQTTTAEPLSSIPAWVRVNFDPGCPASSVSNACGFQRGEPVIVYDDAGAFDFLSVTDVASDAIAVDATSPLSRSYRRGARLSSIFVRRFAWDRAGAQLVHAGMDGRRMPIADHVSSVRFDFFGDPNPPALRARGGTLVATYGPTPSPIDVQGDPWWPPGSNCTFAVVDNGVATVQVARLARLSGDESGLVQLQSDRTGVSLSDGPWCPDPLSANRWDADLLRVRRIAMTIQVHPPVLALVGHRLEPLGVAIDITPANMGLRR